MYFEDLSEKIGGCGLYHYITFFLLAITTFKMAVDLQGLTFALYEPSFHCDVNGTTYKNNSYTKDSFPGYVAIDQCSYRLENNSVWIPCQKWTYDTTMFQSSMITEFNLVCSKKYYKSMIYAFFFLSEIIGYPLIIFSDKVGRRFILLSCLYLSIPVTVIQVLSYQLWVQVLFTFFSGITKSIYISLAMSTLVEIMPMHKFDIAVSNFWVFYSVGYMSTAAFAYIGRTWRIIYAMSLMLSGFYVLYLCFIPETPRWLMLKGRKEESFKVMSFMAKINKRVLIKSEFDKWNPSSEETGNVFHIFKFKRMILRCLLIIFTAWSFSFAYIGTSTDLTFASDNIFLTTLVMGMVEIPTGPLAGLVARKMSRKLGMTCLCSLGILCLICMPFFESDSTKSLWQPWLKVILAMGGKLGFTSAWCLFDVITNEIFPTSIRNGGICIAYISVCLGSIVTPKVHEVALTWHFAVPCLFYACLLIITVVLLRVFLPETKDLPLSQTIEEAVALETNKENEWKTMMIEKRGLCMTNQEETL